MSKRRVTVIRRVAEINASLDRAIALARESRLVITPEREAHILDNILNKAGFR